MLHGGFSATVSTGERNFSVFYPHKQLYGFGLRCTPHYRYGFYDMKIQVKRASSFHSGESLSKADGNPGQAPKMEAVVLPKQRKSSNVVLAIVLVVLMLIGSLVLLGSIVDNGDDEKGSRQIANSTTAPKERPQLTIPAQSTKNETVRPQTMTPEDREFLIKQGLDPDSAVIATNYQQQPQVNGIAYIGTFYGETNFAVPSDYVVSMKPSAIQFKINGQTFDYSGHFAMMLNAPRKHFNPLLGLGTPEKGKMVIIDDFGGQAMWLPNATIWEKSDGFIDFEAMGKEWIYSGAYTIQN